MPSQFVTEPFDPLMVPPAKVASRAYVLEPSSTPIMVVGEGIHPLMYDDIRAEADAMGLAMDAPILQASTEIVEFLDIVIKNSATIVNVMQDGLPVLQELRDITVKALRLYQKYRFRFPDGKQHPDPPSNRIKVSMTALFKDETQITFSEWVSADDSLHDDPEELIEKMRKYKEYLQKAEMARFSKFGGNWELDAVVTRDGDHIRRKDQDNGN